MNAGNSRAKNFMDKEAGKAERDRSQWQSIKIRRQRHAGPPQIKQGAHDFDNATDQASLTIRTRSHAKINKDADSKKIQYQR